ncbi:uncharacterized protein P174DRAFT_365998 [Aspergillus novofumigatus IBT 16806]|uniref:Uncharacterized protein n=1 Tax=Aspergillus novofumigatus (strain IBT 16806) TaxID=1392255 RepID=A0A2I1CF83_ASPN1|nr:uncharacterized protein P174DRAFT_365998 [Aspergillus novofumigatus IBT 16806]PKX96282.1 hypothetical protein P174DRAFT_365998 [Aspergillus novofumigatus IBT 16806]
MAWYRALLPCKSWWQKVLGRNSTNKDGQNEDDQAPLINQMPIFKEITIMSTTAKYINSEKVMEHIVMETKHIDDQGHTCINNCDLNSIAETRHSRHSSISLSDQSTIIDDAKSLEEPELFAAHSPYVDNSTSEWMVRLYYKQSVRLDELEIRGLESRIPGSDDDPIETHCHYQGEDFWLYVPYSYARARIVLNIALNAYFKKKCISNPKSSAAITNHPYQE